MLAITGHSQRIGTSWNSVAAFEVGPGLDRPGMRLLTFTGLDGPSPLVHRTDGWERGRECW